MGQTSEDAIVIYPSRWKTRVWLILSEACSLLLLLGCLGIFALMIVVPAARNGGSIFAALLFLGLAALGFWPSRVLANLLTSREPMLVITHQGIHVGKLYGSFTIVLPWADIAAIYARGDGFGKQLFIRPTNVRLFLSRFGPQMRFFLRINLMNGAPIAIAQSLLERPIAEIVDQVAQLYAGELHDYHVQLAPLSAQ